MHELNLPAYPFKVKTEKGKQFILDSIRKKYVTLTPEEWVRQHFTQYLVQQKKCPLSLISHELSLKYDRLNKRSDIVVHNKEGKPWLIVECKAPKVKINQEVFDQVAQYNYILKVEYLVVTNGLAHFCCKMDYTNNSYVFVQEVPPFA